MATVKGGAKTRKALRRAEGFILEAVNEQFDDYAELVLSLSNDLAPQLTGDMIGSSGTDARKGKSVTTRTVFYKAPYAVRQHEGFFNPGPITKTKPGAGRKYLSRAYDQTRGKFLKRLGKAIGRSIRVNLR